MKTILASFLALISAICCAGSLPTLPPAPAGGEFTFAVLGDNRGSEDGTPAPEFMELLSEINRTDAKFALNSGDLVNGYTGKDQVLLRRQWVGYMKALGSLKVPMFNTPGNHDINNESTGTEEMWKEFVGPTYYSFDFGSARFISLDTSTHENRLGIEQENWLVKQLETASDRRVFLFLHAPLFPVDGHIGSAMDQYPADRDRLHALLAKNSAKIGAVFCGHEHLYNHSIRDGINYYITGGAGAPVYAPRIMGGFFHFMLVSVGKSGVTFQIRKIQVKSVPKPRLDRVRGGTVLEDWEDAFSWRTWDESVIGAGTRQHTRHGKGAWKVEYDFTKCQWPLIYTTWNDSIERPRSLVLDVYVPDSAGKNLSISFSLKGKAKEGEKEPESAAPAVELHRGWNRVVTDLSGGWVKGDMAATFGQIQWVLSTSNPKLAGFVVFDNLQAGYGKGKKAMLMADWETGMTWDSWNEYVSMSSDSGLHIRGNRGLRVSYDSGKADEPMVYAGMKPARDFSRVKAVTADIYVPEGGPRAAILLMGDEDRLESPPVQLGMGWNKVKVLLSNSWLEDEARHGSSTIGWKLVPSASSGTSWAVLDNLRAE